MVLLVRECGSVVIRVIATLTIVVAIMVTLREITK